MKKFNKIIIFVLLIAVVATCFASCGKKDKTALDDKTVVSKVNAIVSGDNLYNVEMGEFTLAKLTDELIKAGVIITYTVTDRNGDAVEIKDNKFTVKATGEYTVKYAVKNKGGNVVVDKAYVITENTSAVKTLSAEDINALVDRKNSVLTELFKVANLDYAKYKAIENPSYEIIGATYPFSMLDMLFSEELLSCGISRATWMKVFNNFSSYIDTVKIDDEQLRNESYTKLAVDILDASITPIFFGKESPVAVARLAYNFSYTMAKLTLEPSKSSFNEVKNAIGAFTKLDAQDNAIMAEFLKTIKVAALADLGDIKEISKDDKLAYAVNIYNILAAQNYLPKRSKEVIEKLFQIDIEMLEEFVQFSDQELFYLVVSARAYRSPLYYEILKSKRYDSNRIFISELSDIVIDSSKLEFSLADGANISLMLTNSIICSEDIFKDLFAHENVDELVPTIKAQLKIFIPTDDDLNRAQKVVEKRQSAVDSVSQGKDELVTAFAMFVKLSDIVSPIMSDSIGKEMLIQKIVSMLGGKYVPPIFDPDDQAYLHPDKMAKDMRIILSGVNKKLDDFKVKYRDQLVESEQNVFSVASLFLTRVANAEIEEGEPIVSSEELNKMLGKYFKIFTPTIDSIQQMIGMATESKIEEIITARREILTDPSTAIGNYLPPHKANSAITASIFIINFVDTIRAEMSAEDYFKDLKESVIELLREAMGDEFTNDAVSKIDNLETVYKLSKDTLKLFNNEFIVTVEDTPENEEFITQIDELMVRWAKFMM